MWLIWSKVNRPMRFVSVVRLIEQSTKTFAYTFERRKRNRLGSLIIIWKILVAVDSIERIYSHCPTLMIVMVNNCSLLVILYSRSRSGCQGRAKRGEKEKCSFVRGLWCKSYACMTYIDVSITKPNRNLSIATSSRCNQTEEIQLVHHIWMSSIRCRWLIEHSSLFVHQILSNKQTEHGRRSSFGVSASSPTTFSRENLFSIMTIRVDHYIYRFEWEEKIIIFFWSEWEDRFALKMSRFFSFSRTVEKHKLISKDHSSSFLLRLHRSNERSGRTSSTDAHTRCLINTPLLTMSFSRFQIDLTNDSVIVQLRRPKRMNQFDSDGEKRNDLNIKNDLEERKRTRARKIDSFLYS